MDNLWVSVNGSDEKRNPLFLENGLPKNTSYSSVLSSHNTPRSSISVIDRRIIVFANESQSGKTNQTCLCFGECVWCVHVWRVLLLTNDKQRVNNTHTHTRAMKAINIV